MKQQRTSLLFLFVGLVMVGVIVLWLFSFREIVQEVGGQRTMADLPMLGQQLRQPLEDLTKSFTALKDVVRQIPKTESLPPEAVANIEKKLQEQTLTP